MATTLSENSIAGDLLIYEQLFHKAYPNFKSMDPDTLLRQMIADGVIQMDGLVEKAHSIVGNIERVSTKGQDHADGSDSKKCITRLLTEPGKADRRVGKITNLTHKRGVLRGVVAETYSKTVHYYRIPAGEYDNLKSICVYFNDDGTPKDDGKWSKFKCNTFEESCL